MKQYGVTNSTGNKGVSIILLNEQAGSQMGIGAKYNCGSCSRL